MILEYLWNVRCWVIWCLLKCAIACLNFLLYICFFLSWCFFNFLFWNKTIVSNTNLFPTHFSLHEMFSANVACPWLVYGLFFLRIFFFLHFVCYRREEGMFTICWFIYSNCLGNFLCNYHSIKAGDEKNDRLSFFSYLIL